MRTDIVSTFDTPGLRPAFSALIYPMDALVRTGNCVSSDTSGGDGNRIGRHKRLVSGTLPNQDGHHGENLLARCAWMQQQEVITAIARRAACRSCTDFAVVTRQRGRCGALRVPQLATREAVLRPASDQTLDDLFHGYFHLTAETIWPSPRKQVLRHAHEQNV
jgi:hypothetical protein